MPPRPPAAKRMTIKRDPEEFVVEELLSPSLLDGLSQAPRPFALYRLTKTGLTTPQAAAAAARSLGLPGGAVAYAGLKDKHSHAIQHLTAQAAAAAHEAPAAAQGPGWAVERLGWLDRALSSGDIAGNRFHIVVHGLTRQAGDDMDKAVELLGVEMGTQGSPEHSAGSRAVRFVNYFGDQRFGSARHGRGFLARALVKGDFETALKLAIATPARKDSGAQKRFKRAVAEGWGRWPELLPLLARCPERRAVERLVYSGRDFRAAFAALPYFFQQLCVYAYQSSLWNQTARALVAQRCANLGPVLAAADPFGEMLFPAPRAVPAEFAGMELPLLGYKSELREPWRGAAEQVLSAEGLSTDELRIPGMRRPFFKEEPRQLFAEAREFVLSAPEPDGDAGRSKRTLSFVLPRGAYATVLLRALGQ